MKMDFLKDVLLEKQRVLKETKRVYPEEELRIRMEEPRIWRPFKQAISAPGRLNIIAEIKRASPSEGVLRETFDHLQIARIYQNCGASAISILTEEKYFSGKMAYLKQVRKVVDLPILRKDFIFEPYQLYESKFFGADAVLLIAELLKDGKLAEFLAIAKRLDLDCLVEVGGAQELKYAIEQGAEIIGINNRDLHTLEVSKIPDAELFEMVPEGRVIVAESGIKTNRDYLAYKKLKVNAVLIGSAFMKAEDIAKKFKEISEEKEVKVKVKKPSVKSGTKRKKTPAKSKADKG